MAKKYEEKIQIAKESLEKLNNPEISLEESMNEYKKGLNALKEATNLLENAKLEYEELSKDKNDD